MPDVLAIHWERRRLRILEVSIGGALRVTQGFVVDVPESPSVGWLRSALHRHNVSAKQALVSLPREDAILRQLELPDAPDDELPLLVHFQASTRSATPLDQLLLDYIPLPRRPGSPSKDVLMASVPRATVDPIRGALAEAGLELISLSISSFSLAELVAHSEAARRMSENQRSLIIQLDAGRLEIVLLGNRQLLASHVVRSPLDEQGRPNFAKAAAEVSRVLVPSQPWLDNGRLDRIWLVGAGDEGQVLAEALRERWHCSIESFDPHRVSTLIDFDPTKLSEPSVRFLKRWVSH
jgi:Tfp pilus assembly PilM family ATPase